MERTPLKSGRNTEPMRCRDNHESVCIAANLAIKHLRITLSPAWRNVLPAGKGSQTRNRWMLD